MDQEANLKELSEVAPDQSQFSTEDEISAVQREITAIYTKGTFTRLETDQDLKSHDPSFERLPTTLPTKFVLLFVLNPERTLLGFTFFDVSLLQFFTGSFGGHYA